MSVTDELLENARRHAAEFGNAHLSPSPSRQIAVVACMDARIDTFALLGLSIGDAHIIRNAGGVITPDEIRSLAISQRMLGTREIILIHHTDCGMLRFTDDEFRERMREDTGVTPDWAVETFSDLDADVRQSINRVLISPFIPHKESVRGFVYDVKTGELREVER